MTLIQGVSSAEEQNSQPTVVDMENIEEPTNDVEDEEANNDRDDSDDDMTVIVLEHGMEQVAGWADQDSPEMEERRRNVLLRELQRAQRASFIHFLILCLIPTSLLFVVVATVLGEDESCESLVTTCQKEPRTFINAFTTRCVCDAITVMSSSNP